MRLRVVTKALEPLVILDGEEPAGFSIELWDALAERIGLEYEWVIVTTVAEQLEAVKNGSADAAIAGISMTPEREQLIDFSHPYFNAGLQILTTTRQSASFASWLSLITSPALLQILLVGLVITLLMAHIIWLTERNSNPEVLKGYLPGIWESIWMTVRTLATGEYAGEASGSVIKRLLAIFWVVLSIILIAQFTGSITAILTVQQLTGSISGPEDLPGKRIATVQGTTAAHYLTNQHLNFVGVTTIDEAYNLLAQNRVQAIVYDAPVLLYHSLTAGKGREQVVGPVFHQETYGIALPTGSPWRETINTVLLELRQDGTYDEIYSKWFGAVE